jgi:hypothetical protein
LRQSAQDAQDTVAECGRRAGVAGAAFAADFDDEAAISMSAKTVFELFSMALLKK